MKKVKVGLIGVGGISKKHIDELLCCSDAQIVAICDINPAAIAEKNARLNLAPEKCYSDYHELLADSEVEAVEIMTPNCLHAEIAITALQAGKHINLEKPVAMNYEEAVKIAKTVKEQGLLGMTCFSYRYKPAVRYAKQLVDEGRLGQIIGVNVSYLKDSAFWEGRRLEWRFVKSEAGSGVIGDLAVHLIDLAQLLAGNITELCAMQKTVVKERTLLDGSGQGKVETDDMCGFLASFACGAQGTFHITRCSIGNKNTIKYDVYGTRGALSFNLNSADEIDVCIGEGDPKNYTFQTIKVPAEYRLDQEQAFINAILGKRDALFPTLEDGAQGQLIVDSILKSAEEKRWIPVI